MRKTTLALLLAASLSATSASANSVSEEFQHAYQNYQEALKSGKKAAILSWAREANSLGTELFEDTNPNRLSLQHNLANAILKNELYVEAKGSIEELVPLYLHAYGDGSAQHVELLLQQALVDAIINNQSKSFKGSKKASISLLDFAQELAKTYPEQAFLVRYSLIETFRNHRQLYLPLKQVISLTEQSVEALTEKFGKEDLRTIEHQYFLAQLYTSKKGKKKAIQAFEQIVDITENKLDFTHPYELAAHAQLVGLYEKRGESEKATKHCVAIGSMTPWDDNIEPTPLYRVPPKYPVSAARKNKQGWVRMTFDISPSGMVDNIQVLDSEPGKTFIKESIKALEQWRYAPKFVDGVATSATNMKVQLDFKLSKS